MCLYPRLIKNRKYTVTKKNGGVVPAILDNRTAYVPVGCQKCMECKKQKARGWQVRLQEDIKTNRNAKFVTLTFSTESLQKLARLTKYKLKIKELKRRPKHYMVRTYIAPKLEAFKLQGYQLDNAICKLAVRYFTERWRKKFKKSIRHWLVTELGHENTEHVHLHGLLWTDENKETISERWDYGFVWIGDYVNEKTVNYIIKYIHKQDLGHKYY